MKLRKLLTPILGAVGTCAAITPLVCLTSCGDETVEATMVKLDALQDKTLKVTSATTASWEINATVETEFQAKASNITVSSYVTSADDNVDIVQCRKELNTYNLKTFIGYVAKEVEVTKTTTFTTEFKLIFELKENGKIYQQIIDGFKIEYTVTK